jgi:hypothetical protein
MQSYLKYTLNGFCELTQSFNINFRMFVNFKGCWNSPLEEVSINKYNTIANYYDENEMLL